MAKKQKQKRSILPKIEIMIILVFFFSFIIWAVSQCQAKKLFYEAQDVIENSLGQSPAKDTVATPINTTQSTNPNSKNNVTIEKPSTTNPQSRVNTIQQSYTPLYVSIEGLNLRTGPHLDSSIILKLALYEEVLFLNEITDSTQIINMGEEFANEPWIKVQQKKGHVGWVYGAGVNYYKRKRSGFQ